MDNKTPAMDALDWRTHFNPYSRQQILANLMDKLKKHMIWYDLEEDLLLDHLKEFSEKYDERIYNGAKSESDYIRKISPYVLDYGSPDEGKTSSSNLCYPIESEPELDLVPESRVKVLLDILLSTVVELAVLSGAAGKRILEFQLEVRELGELNSFWAGVRYGREMTIVQNPGVPICFDFLPPGFDDEDDDL